jgi:hypothetical protein
MAEYELRFRWDILWIDWMGRWFATPCVDRSEMTAKARHATHRRFEWVPGEAVQAHVGPLVRCRFDVGSKSLAGEFELEPGDEWERPGLRGSAESESVVQLEVDG